MSRSYKYPIFTDYNRGSKQLANRKVRQRVKSMFSFSKGNWYRKIFNQYNICEFKFFPRNENDKLISMRK